MFVIQRYNHLIIKTTLRCVKLKIRPLAFLTKNTKIRTDK